MTEKFQLHSEQLDQIATAMVKCQASINGAVKNSKNPHYKSDYADLAAVWEAVKGPMSENGLSIIQSIMSEGNKEFLVTTLLHVSGQWFKSQKYLKLGRRDDMQGDGSAITYARRYSLAAIMGVPQVDDDGNACSHQKPTENKARAVKPEEKKVELVKGESGVKSDLILSIKRIVSALVKKDRLKMDWIKKTYEIPNGAEDLVKKEIPVLKEIFVDMQSLSSEAIDEFIKNENGEA